jgi:hypothetical protein
MDDIFYQFATCAHEKCALLYTNHPSHKQQYTVSVEKRLTPDQSE